MTYELVCARSAYWACFGWNENIFEFSRSAVWLEYYVLVAYIIRQCQCQRFVCELYCIVGEVLRVSHNGKANIYVSSLIIFLVFILCWIMCCIVGFRNCARDKLISLHNGAHWALIIVSDWQKIYLFCQGFEKLSIPSSLFILPVRRHFIVQIIINKFALPWILCFKKAYITFYHNRKNVS